MEARRSCIELLLSDHYADCVSPCAVKCPGGVDIQGYMSLVKRGLYREAVELIKEQNPLPIVCGRVCVRECEVGCRRSILDAPVGIDFIKRFAAESKEGMSYVEKKKPRCGKSVGIVGAGPAGLSAAYYLAREGYDVVMYEAMSRPGGMLLYGIPAYRLPKELLAKEIDMIKAMGVEIRCNKALGKDVTMEELCSSHNAVLLAQGAWGASRMRVEKEDAPGVLTGLKMLRDVAEGSLKELTGRVLVVGGGNTAIDASRTSVRIGAQETAVIYRRTEAEMPAHHEEIDAAKKEGVVFTFLVAPKRVVVNDEGRVTGLECIRMEQGAPDSSGRRKPVPVEGSEYIEKADWIIAAIGQYPDLVCLKGKENDITCLAGCIVVNRDSMETSAAGIFSAGDVVTGPATVIEGIAGGRRAAYSIHEILAGTGTRKKCREFVISKEVFAPVSVDDLSCHGCSERACMPERPASERVKDFREVELGLSKTDTEKEAERCLSCGCIEVNDCALRRYAGQYGIDMTRYLGEVNKYAVDERHPLILIDPNKCIKCGRCIKTCQKILDAPALGFINRGFSSIISPAMMKPLLETTCVSCGNCIDSCPTGALTENLPLLARLGDRIKETPSVCSFCSVGCRINIKAFGRDMRIRSLRDGITGNGDYLCRKGRFGSRYLAEEGRLEQPVVRRDGKARYTDWKSAMEYSARLPSFHWLTGRK